ncbi:MAG: hypothetical protein BWX86_01378 [Verrucomicrobia bacterium ADurb.Bin122]|nr:MAG: hypothetical protein BWX86_01378 [Verrucomicrobia bacterium ADurb.Bin122]
MGGHAAAHGDEEDEGDRGGEEGEPGAVGEQILEVAADGGLLLLGWADALLRVEENDEEGGDDDDADDYEGEGPAALLVAAAEGFREGQEGGGDHHAGGVREDEFNRGEGGALVGVGRHDAEHGGVGDVDRGVDQHEGVVGHDRPDEFAGVAEVWSREGEHAGDGHGHAEPEQVGAELAPACLGAVGDHADHGIEEGVEAAAGAEHGGGGGGGDAEDVRIEKGQVNHERLPVEA